MPKKKPKTRAVTIGRPTVFTDLVIQKLEEAFSIDATVREACAYAGIAESTYYAEAKDNPAFSERMDRAMQFAFMLAKKTVIQAMKTNDGALAMKWLKNRQRDRYHEKVENVNRETPVEELIAEVEKTTEYSERFGEKQQ
jgi:hypothetical protein